jgi:hypothetical protein
MTRWGWLRCWTGGRKGLVDREDEGRGKTSTVVDELGQPTTTTTSSSSSSSSDLIFAHK